MNTEQKGDQEVIAPVTVILPDADTVDNASPKVSEVLENNSKVVMASKDKTSFRSLDNSYQPQTRSHSRGRNFQALSETLERKRLD